MKGGKKREKIGVVEGKQGTEFNGLYMGLNIDHRGLTLIPKYRDAIIPLRSHFQKDMQFNKLLVLFLIVKLEPFCLFRAKIH